MSKEIELKLELETGGEVLVAIDPILQGVEPKRTPQLSIYYDTPKGALARNGFSLRVRAVSGRYVQTLKQTNSCEGLLSRDEWEWEVAGEAPELDRLEQLSKKLPSLPLGKLHRKLGPVIRSKVDRTSWQVVQGATELQLDLDVGTICSGNQTVGLTELEFELLSGAPVGMIEVARSIAERLPARLGVLSKAERGGLLAEGRLGNTSKAAPVIVCSKTTVAEAFGTIAHACIKHYRLNEDAVIKHSRAEALHQARVALRRLRSAFTFFRPVITDGQYPQLREELRWFTSQLGDARNLDVFLKRSLPDAERERSLERREQAYGQVVEAMNSVRFRLLLVDLIGWLGFGEWKSRRPSERPIRAYAGKRLDKLWAKIEPAGRSLARLNEESRHELRIQVKKMRYAIEFFDQLYESSRKQSFKAAIEALQEDLGELNDMATARSLASPDNANWWIDQSNEVEHLRRGQGHMARIARAGPFWREATGR